MNQPTDRKPPEDVFLEALASELIAMPNDQVLEGPNPAEVRSFGESLLNSARTEASRRRMQRAKAALVDRDRTRHYEKREVSASDARAYLATAENDPRYTMAARKLSEMSDEDVIRLYHQMRELDSSDGR